MRADKGRCGYVNRIEKRGERGRGLLLLPKRGVGCVNFSGQIEEKAEFFLGRDKG